MSIVFIHLICERHLVSTRVREYSLRSTVWSFSLTLVQRVNRFRIKNKESIISEHERVTRPLRPHFEEMYQRALYYRLQANTAKNSVEDILPATSVSSST